MGLFGANMADFQMGLALDARGQQGGRRARRLNQRVAARPPRLNRGLRAIGATPVDATPRFGETLAGGPLRGPIAQDDDPRGRVFT